MPARYLSLPRIIPVAACGLLIAVAHAQTSAPFSPFRELDRYAFGYAYPGSQLKDHIYERSRRFFALGDAQRDALRTTDAVRSRQEEIRRVVVANLGGLPPEGVRVSPSQARPASSRATASGLRKLFSSRARGITSPRISICRRHVRLAAQPQCCF